MNMDLATQIRDYTREVHLTEQALTLDEISKLRLSAEPVRPIGPTPFSAEPRQRLPRLVTVAAVTTVLILAVGATWFLGGVGSNAPVATTPPTDTLASFAWSRVPHNEGVFGRAVMDSVTVGGPGLVAVGEEPSRGAAAVWNSVDGVTWSRVPDDEAFFGDASMSSVTVGGPGLVAVGQAHSQAAVWTSPDGMTWSPVQLEGESGGEDPQRMESVTVGGPGLVAVGADGPHAAVWTSPDGITWSRVPHNDTVFAGDGLQLQLGQWMNSVTSGGPGLVAVGTTEAVGGGYVPDQEAAVWTSSDGITWSRVPHDEAVFGGDGIQHMTSVTVGGPGLVAVGADGSGYGGDAAVWTSPDGITWSRVPHDEAVFGGTYFQAMAGVTVADSGLVAVGWDESDAEMVAAAWTSSDGTVWSRVLHDEAVFAFTQMTDVTAGGPGVVTVGVRRPIVDSGLDAAVWTAATQD